MTDRTFDEAVKERIEELAVGMQTVLDTIQRALQEAYVADGSPFGPWTLASVAEWLQRKIEEQSVVAAADRAAQDLEHEEWLEEWAVGHGNWTRDEWRRFRMEMLERRRRGESM